MHCIAMPGQYFFGKAFAAGQGLQDAGAAILPVDHLLCITCNLSYIEFDTVQGKV